MHRIILSSVVCLAQTYFSTLPLGVRGGGELLKIKFVLSDYFHNFCLKQFPSLRTNQHDATTQVYRSSCTVAVLVLLCHILIKLEFPRHTFVVAPCMLIVLSPLFVQLMLTNYYKIVKQLK